MPEFSFIPRELMPAAFMLYFLTMWCTISLLIAFLGGWRRLAREFKATEDPYGDDFYWQSGAVGWASYTNCLNFHTTREGLFVSVMFLYSIGHPTLFIPWREIHVLHENRFLWIRTVTIAIGNPQIGRMTLPEQVFAQREHHT